MRDTPSRPRKGLRRARAACLAAVAACAVSAVATSSAQATPGTMTLDHGFIDLGALTGIEVLTPADPASVTITPDTGTAFHVLPADFVFPHFTGDQSGVTIDIDLALDPSNNVTGTYDPATGTMTTNPANFDVTIALSGLLGTGTCVMDVPHGNAIPMSFSTEATSPYLGDRFDALSDPPVNGAIETNWADLPASTQTSGGLCGVVDALKAGPGGLWLSNGIATPSKLSPPPPSGGGTTSAPAPTSTPKKKKCKKGFKKVKVHGKIKCKKKKRKK